MELFEHLDLLVKSFDKHAFCTTFTIFEVYLDCQVVNQHGLLLPYDYYVCRPSGGL